MVLIRAQIGFIAERAAGDQPEISRRLDGNHRSHRRGIDDSSASGSDCRAGRAPGPELVCILIQTDDQLGLCDIVWPHARRSRGREALPAPVAEGSAPHSRAPERECQYEQK
jgi:hypothetical protein